MTTSKPELREDQERIVQIGGYAAFQATEGIPIITGFAVDDLRTVEVKPWARLECLGAYINLDGAGATNDAYVAEIEPGKKMAPERHIFEKNIYVLEGRGATLVGDDPNSRISFEWHKGSVFSVPINVWHQHLNGSGTEPARFVAVTTAPLTMNLFHNEGFIFNNSYVFEDRMGGAKLFQGEGRQGRRPPREVCGGRRDFVLRAEEGASEGDARTGTRSRSLRSRSSEQGGAAADAGGLRLPAGARRQLYGHRSRSEDREERGAPAFA